MHVWIFQTGEPIHIDLGQPRPMRAMNLANILVQEGHRVTLWTSAFHHQQKTHRSRLAESHRVNDLLEIRLIPSNGYKRNISFGRLYDHFQLALRLGRELKHEKVAPDIGFVGYPPIEFAYVATRWLKSKNIPMVLDAKDQWPHIFIDASPRSLRGVVFLIFLPYFVLGRAALRNSTAFSSVSQSFLHWMESYSGRSLSEDDIVAPLSPIAERIGPLDRQDAELFWRKLSIYGNDKIRFVFVGSLSQAFDFDPISELAKKAEKGGLDWEFIICGDGPERRNVEELFSGCHNAIFPGWVDRAQISVVMRYSTMGLAPYKRSKDFLDSIPNKIIDYLSYETPILTSLSGEVGSLIRQHNCGLVYSKSDAEQLFIQVQTLVSDANRLRMMGSCANQIFNKMFAGEAVYKKLAYDLERLVEKRARGRDTDEG